MMELPNVPDHIVKNFYEAVDVANEMAHRLDIENQASLKNFDAALRGLRSSAIRMAEKLREPVNVFSGILLRPMALETRQGEVVCMPRGTQITVRACGSDSDIAPNDVQEAVELGGKL